ncbi:MAG: hypothetical protein Q8M91_12405 [Polaromonas sp.]|jgi:hypothetical protein|nr:hypothetical protein [Polaromonas sp.]MDP3171131.1 hypothetical protein [Polaromonas sp.]MDP3310063.1 hypothetical protein [Polaromonas sp.]MDP3412270.1 hypothetical protein [Polaromonas sp.]
MKRRTLFKLGVASAALLALGGGAAALLQPGLQNGKLTGAGREVFRAVGRAVLQGSLPADEAPMQVGLDGLLERIDALTLALPPHAQDELSQLLSLLASVPGRHLLAGLDRAWPAASDTDIQQALDGMRFSALVLRQQAYAALHDITAAAYFTDVSTWPQLGYPGPLAI